MDHFIVDNLKQIKNEVLLKKKDCKIIAVSKTFQIEKIRPLLEFGHIDFGENKVQEAVEKWSEIKKKNSQVKLHMVGKLQTNKVKFAVQIFDYIHSVDNIKIAKKISDEQNKINKKIKVFLQVNIGDENQKSGVNKNELEKLVFYSKEIGLDIIGLMCIPPVNIDPESYFEEMNKLNKSFGFMDLSMGMSSDFLLAAKHSSTFVRVGSGIFGQRF